MHELGVVTHVAKTLDEIAAENNIKEIASVTLQVGEVAGILNDYFLDCWDYFKVKHEPIKNAVMNIEMVEAVTFCEDCKQTYSTVKYGRICPYCKSEHTYLVQGNECVIKEITVNDEGEE